MKKVILVSLLLCFSPIKAFLQSKDEVYYKNIGNEYLSKEDYVNAELYYDSSLMINPNYANAFCNKGLVYYFKGNSQKSIEYYSKAILLNKKLPQSYTNRAKQYIVLNDYNAALRDYNLLAAEYPNDFAMKSKVEKMKESIEILKRGKPTSFPLFEEWNNKIKKEIYQNIDKYQFILKNYGKPSEISEGMIVAHNGDKSCVFNENLEMIVPFRYKHIVDYSEGLAYVEKEQGSGFIDKKGIEVKSFNWQSMFLRFKDGLCAIPNPDDVKYSYYMDRNFNVLNNIPFSFGSDWKDGKKIVESKGKFFIIDKSYKIIDKLPDNIFFSWYDIYFFKNNGLYGWMDSDGQILQEAKYKLKEWESHPDYTEAFYRAHEERLIKVDEGENRVLLVDKYGKKHTDFDFKKFDSHREFHTIDNFLVEKNENYGVLDRNYNIKVPFIYSNLYENYTTAGDIPNGKIKVFIEASIYGQWGVINEKNQVIIPIIFDDFGVATEINGVLYLCAQYKGKWGVVSTENKIIIDFIWDKKPSRLLYDDGFWEVGQGDLRGIFSFDGKPIIPIKYQNIHVENGYFLIDWETNPQYFDMNGNKVITNWKK